MARKTKHIASVSLGVMGVGFVSTLFVTDSIAGRVLQGGFEGGLVGGLADWFAVTALFRHPMGLPIPHTALVLKNRKRITEQFIQVLEQDWLSKESIQQKIQEIPLSSPIFQALERTETQTMLLSAIRSGVEQLLQTIDQATVLEWVEKELKSYMQSLDLQTILSALIQQAIDHDYDSKVFDTILNKVDEWIQQDTTKTFLGSIAIDSLQRAEWDGFMQFAMRQLLNMINEEKVGGILQQLIGKGIRDLQNPQSQNRIVLAGYIRQELLAIPEHSEWVQEWKTWKDTAIVKLDLRSHVETGIQILKQKLTSFIHGTGFEEFVTTFIQKGIDSVRNNPSAVATLEGSIQQHISGFVEQNHSKIGQLVKENLEKLDDEELIAMMEERLGQDLQWIRVNGAVCGWLIGLVIAAIKVLVHP